MPAASLPHHFARTRSGSAHPYGRDRGETEMMGFDDIDAAIITGIFLIGLLLVAVVRRLSAGASDRDTHDQRRFRGGD